METRVQDQSHWLDALIDSGAEEDFISQTTVVSLGLQGVPPKTTGMAVDGHPITIYREHTLDVEARDRHGQLAVTRLRPLATNFKGFDLILGMPWLKAVDPDIRFSTGQWAIRTDPHAIRGKDSGQSPPSCEAVEKMEDSDGSPSTKSVRIHHVSVHQLLAEEDKTPYVAWCQPVVVASRVIVRLMQTREESLPPEYADYHDVVADPGELGFPPGTKVEHSIDLMPGTTAPFGPLYPLSGKELHALRVYLEEALEKGWIRKSESAAGAPILFVPKKDGSLRLCVDYRGLNKVTIKNRYPLPLISEILDRLAQAKVLTQLDLRDAYHRIRVKEADRWKTSFRTRYGQYEYLVMPFGLTNAPATFQSYINEALHGLTDTTCIAYMDDILIFSQNKEEHVQHVQQVLQRLREYSLFIKLSKCKFHVDEVDFLGFRVGKTGVGMDPARVVAIRDWERPETYHAVQVFLGFTNFYRGFIDRYSQITAPLTDLLKGMKQGRKPGKIDWKENDRANTAFQELKRSFMKAPLLRHYQPDHAIRVETDASGKGIGGVLSQLFPEDGGQIWHPIAFYSRKMKEEETRYSTGDQEMLAIIHAFKEWRHYLESPDSTVTVITDHEALLKFMDTKVLARKRQTRWAEFLAAFDFKIEWRAGKRNPADGLSRMPAFDAVDKSENQEHMLQELVLLRSKDSRESREKSDLPITKISRVRVAILTRAASIKERTRRDSTWAAANPLLEEGDAHASATASAGAEESARTGSQRISSTRRKRKGMRGKGFTVPDNKEDAPQHPLDRPEPLRESREDSGILGVLRESQVLDSWVTERRWEQYPAGTVTKGAMQGKWAVDENGIVRRDGMAYVPNDPAIRAEILRVNHDDPWEGGHFGVAKTVEVIQSRFWWPNMKGQVIDYIKTCDICQRMKVPRQKPAGLLAPLPIPGTPWEGISMDFIVELPPSLHRRLVYDSVLVVVDRHSKMVRLIPCNNDITAEELGVVLIDEVFTRFGRPSSIVSDRGSLFTSRYWETFCHFLKVKRKLSTAFRPQTDGQTERVNQVVECYLRCYLNDEQDNWAELLSGAEYAINNTFNATINAVPFQIVHTFDPRDRLVPASQTNLRQLPRDSHEKELQVVNEKAKSKIDKMHEARIRLQEAWTKAQERIKKYYDHGHRATQFSKGQWVMLSSRNIRLAKPKRKLADKFIGPFQIEEAVGPNAYRVALPQKYGRIHSTFHVSLLRLYHRRPGTEPPDPVDIDGEEAFVVEAILDACGRGKRRRWLVKWEGWSNDHNTWEPRSHLENVSHMIEEFKNRGRRPQTS